MSPSIAKPSRGKLGHNTGRSQQEGTLLSVCHLSSTRPKKNPSPSSLPHPLPPSFLFFTADTVILATHMGPAGSGPSSECIVSSTILVALPLPWQRRQSTNTSSTNHPSTGRQVQPLRDSLTRPVLPMGACIISPFLAFLHSPPASRLRPFTNRRALAALPPFPRADGSRAALARAYPREPWLDPLGARRPRGPESRFPEVCLVSASLPICLPFLLLMARLLTHLTPLRRYGHFAVVEMERAPSGRWVLVEVRQCALALPTPTL